MNDRENFAAIAVALLFLSLVGGCVHFVTHATAEVAKENRQRVQEVTVSESEFARTVKHDGHWWVLWTGKENVSHHPDCPCGKGGQAEREAAQ